MTMIHESDVRNKVALLVQHKLSLVSFERWLVSESWNMHSDRSAEAIDLVSSIHVLLSERDDSVVDESELRRELLLLLNRINESIVIMDDSIVRRRSPAVQLSASTTWVSPSPLVLPAST